MLVSVKAPTKVPRAMRNFRKISASLGRCLALGAASPRMFRLRKKTVVMLLMLATTGNAFTASAGSPSFERATAREDRAKEWTQTFTDWTLVCRETSRIKRHACKLRTLLRDDRNLEIAIDLSKDETDPPAAILHLPTGLAIENGVTIRDGRSESRTMPIAVCTGTECQAVWSLTKAELAALDAGRTLHASYRTASIEDLPIFTVQLPSLPLSRFRISGNGFHEAIEASLH